MAILLGQASGILGGFVLYSKMILSNLLCDCHKVKLIKSFYYVTFAWAIAEYSTVKTKRSTCRRVQTHDIRASDRATMCLKCQIYKPDHHEFDKLNSEYW